MSKASPEDIDKFFAGLNDRIFRAYLRDSMEFYISEGILTFEEAEQIGVWLKDRNSRGRRKIVDLLRSRGSLV